ncbi:RNA polymerase sigma factor [Pseudoalteromonas sp. S16_S37]|uniref:RNA polymerase sigma factor n=1 Tax=Pseudoalteromonas sp. S16_S37 TaxID=2720228 RepID=UPI00168030FF|nr:sigma-70 family RNA polymerase sigma factor [Pseudoalteromonas sp. S16_S37]MBD1583135.1 sigma-70 family RNA polymerase sigma factor [Pseudoalteromonas sp. S16_S37]
MLVSRNSYLGAPSRTNPHVEFWGVWAEYNERVLSCCYKWLHNDSGMIEDAMALTREKAYQAYGNNAGNIENTFAWLCRIAHNVCMDVHRLNSKENDLVGIVSSSPSQFYFSENYSPTLENDYERHDLYQQLSHAINNLPNDLKQAIQYKFIYEMEYAEIAEQLQISQENVRKRVQLARKKLSALRVC